MGRWVIVVVVGLVGTLGVPAVASASVAASTSPPPPAQTAGSTPATPPATSGATPPASTGASTATVVVENDLFCGFVDVPAGAFFDVPACYLRQQGLTTGSGGPTTYAPNVFVSRAQMAAFLWRAAGSPANSGACGFADQAAIPGFARQAACWLKAQRITTNNPFNPSGIVNRAQMATFLWRQGGAPPGPGTCSLSDQATIPAFARTAVCWLKAQGITTNNPFNAAGQVNRGQMAAFLWRAAGSPFIERDNPAAMVLWFDTTGSTDQTITLPLGGTVDATIDWGDGEITTADDVGDGVHTYASPGYYRITITGTLTGFGTRCTPDVDKLVAVPSFGELGLTSLDWAFAGAGRLVRVPRVLPSSVTSLEGTFADPLAEAPCVSPSGAPTSDRVTTADVDRFPDWSALDVTTWDTGNVTNMASLFAGQTEFNDDISGWDTGSVTNMRWMLALAFVFNQDIGGWDVSNVTDLTFLFQFATAFNQDLSGWDVSNVTNMSGTFYGTTAFNQPLATWDTSNVTNMEAMFSETGAFNQDIGNWNTSNVVNMFQMFGGADAFNRDIGNWDVSNVTNMRLMFRGTTAFNQDIGNWNTSNVTSMQQLFLDAKVFNQDLSSWNTSSVVNFAEFDLLADAWLPAYKPIFR